MGIVGCCGTECCFDAEGRGKGGGGAGGRGAESPTVPEWPLNKICQIYLLLVSCRAKFILVHQKLILGDLGALCVAHMKLTRCF